MEVISIQSSVFLFLISDCDVVYAEGNSYLHANLGEMEMCDDKRVIVQKQCLVEQKKWVPDALKFCKMCIWHQSETQKRFIINFLWIVDLWYAFSKSQGTLYKKINLSCWRVVIGCWISAVLGSLKLSNNCVIALQAPTPKKKKVGKSSEWNWVGANDAIKWRWSGQRSERKL